MWPSTASHIEICIINSLNQDERNNLKSSDYEIVSSEILIVDISGLKNNKLVVILDFGQL